MGLIGEILSNGIVQTIVGGLIAAITGVVALGIGRRNEHGKWLREERVGAYARYLAHVDEYRAMKSAIAKEQREVERLRADQDRIGEEFKQLESLDLDAAREKHSDLNAELKSLRVKLDRGGAQSDHRRSRLRELRQETFSMMSGIEILGPDEVNVKVIKLHSALRKNELKGVREARADLVRVMRDVLQTTK